MHISEVAGDSYDIMWNSFTYETLLRDGECHQFGTPLSIFQLDEISWTGSDCGASGSSSGSSYGSAYQQPYSCARTVHFAIPFNTSGVDIIRTRYTARKRFVSRDKQPIDASRGAVVPSSASHIMRCTIDAPCSAFSSIVITEPLLVLSPIPDMSMPYNVITLVSTLVAFFVGTFINALFKRRESNS